MTAGITITSVQKLFFDRAGMQSRLDRADKAALSRAGAMIRLTAQRSMRPGGKKGKSSRPGEPPRTHGERLLRKHLYYFYNPQGKSVVIGPVLLPGKANKNRGQTVPETLEYSGAIDATQVLYRGAWMSPSDERIPRKSLRYLPKRRTTARIASRPYMSSAEKVVRPRLTQLWLDALNKA